MISEQVTKQVKDRITSTYVHTYIYAANNIGYLQHVNDADLRHRAVLVSYFSE